MIPINQVYFGDCLDWMPLIDDKSIDMILCDLPYGITACKWDTIIPFKYLWPQYKRIIKDHGCIALTASQPFTTKLINSNLKMFKYCLVWDKQRSCGSFLARKRPLKYHEDIIIFYKHQPIYNPQMEIGPKIEKAPGGKSENYGEIPLKRYINNKYYPKSILSFKACHNMTGKLHPTQKPVALYEYLIKTYTNENDLVLDNCAGSGTIIEACLNTNRNFIAIEKEEKYYNICLERYEKCKTAINSTQNT